VASVIVQHAPGADEHAARLIDALGGEWSTEWM
jgi:hypothetical protein